jgi:Tfp pilus assembly protein FimT
MKKVEFNAQSGKTLIELIIVLVIVMLVVTFAIYQSGTSKAEFNRQNLAREFKNYLERARFDSVKRRPTLDTDKAQIVINSATSYTVKLDLDQNGAINTTDTRAISWASGNVKFVGSNLVYPVTISFDQRGKITITNGVASTSTSDSFTICQSCTIGTANTTNANTISISPSGTVAMLSGAQTLSTAQNPTVTSDNSMIYNPMVKVN